VRKYIDADTLEYLSLEGLLLAVNAQRDRYCSSCYTGRYPVPFPREEAQFLQLPLALDSRRIVDR
jgi:amidophosphoribosyltransferase